MTMAAEELETTGSDREESRFGDSPARGELPDESRAAAFRRELYKPETIDGINSTIEHDVNDIQKFFERPPAGSHAEFPLAARQTLQHPAEAVSVSDLTMAALAAGMVAFELGRRIHRKLDK
jgi:hypothetical protein